MMAVVAGDFAAHLAGVRARDEEKLEWMQSFYDRLSKMEADYQDACKDLESEKGARRHQQELANRREAQLQQLKLSVEQSAFILVLVDADADTYMFKDEYYTSPDGGRKAALDIRSGVKERLGEMNSGLANLPIHVKAFANAEGLAHLLVRMGIARETRVLSEFAKEFSQAWDMADFVLLGRGKDIADKKINGVFRQFVENPTCRHVVFAGCHDNNYVRVLEDYKSNPEIVERVTLLHGFEVGREFGALPFRSMKLGSVFRERPMDIVQAAPALPPPPTPPPPKSPPTARLSVSSSPPKARTWAALANTTAAVTNHTIAVGAGSGRPGEVLVNAAGQRVDSKLPEPRKKDVEEWRHKTKIANMKYCRMYHMVGTCGGGCGYSHGPLSDGEKLVCRRQLRSEACHSGPLCRDPDCFYGHNCSCKKQGCKFPPNMHDVDVSTAKAWVA